MVPTALLPLRAAAYVDAVCYGVHAPNSLPFFFPPLNFLVLNVGRDVASLYGTHPWHWYVTAAVPVFLCLYGMQPLFR